MPLIESELSDCYCFLFLQQLDKLKFDTVCIIEEKEGHSYGF